MPLLWFWSDVIDSGVQVLPDAQEAGMALVCMPIQMQPSANGEVTVPWPFVNYRVVRGPDGTAAAPIYDAKTGKWSESLQRGMVFWLRFTLPASVAGGTLDWADLSIEMDAPGRRVDVMLPSQLVANQDSPGGKMEVAFTEEHGIVLDADHSFLVGVKVHDTLGLEGEYPWQIKAIHLNAGLSIDAEFGPELVAEP